MKTYVIHFIQLFIICIVLIESIYCESSTKLLSDNNNCLASKSYFEKNNRENSMNMFAIDKMDKGLQSILISMGFMSFISLGIFIKILFIESFPFLWMPVFGFIAIIISGYLHEGAGHFQIIKKFNGKAKLHFLWKIIPTAVQFDASSLLITQQLISVAMGAIANLYFSWLLVVFFWFGIDVFPFINNFVSVGILASTVLISFSDFIAMLIIPFFLMKLFPNKKDLLNFDGGQVFKLWKLRKIVKLLKGSTKFSITQLPDIGIPQALIDDVYSLIKFSKISKKDNLEKLLWEYKKRLISQSS